MDSTQAEFVVAVLALVRGALPVFLVCAGFFAAKELLRLCGFTGGEKVQL